MTNKHCDSTDVGILLDLLDELGIKRKEAFKFLDVSQTQFYNWQRKGRVPNKNFHAFQKGLISFLDKENIRKKVKLGIFELEFIEELLEIAKN
tara:strand:+ start:29 stop:307 length:279 start_codon:yes stop_codon:yes gene_type:complete